MPNNIYYLLIKYCNAINTETSTTNPRLITLKDNNINIKYENLKKSEH